MFILHFNAEIDCLFRFNLAVVEELIYNQET
uniref:Uncharacterized protein n=1 Tax=Siphoviridae sp. ctLqe90 TaxID=2825456 RepID=A0A8S5Q3Y1_9CAUD|nr:MAG TPA: hypothetical protein [Siphoviridae sp. ctLqe90]